MSETLHFAQHRLQEVALVFMALVYTARLYWLTRYKAGKDRQPPTGRATTSPRKGWLYSLAIIAMPWAMESSRRHWLIYGQFVLFHLGVVAAITLSFVIPYAPSLLTPEVVLVVQAFTGTAFAIGLVRIARRAGNRVMRKISSPDDYFSLVLLTVWFAFATLAAPNDLSRGETVSLVYFGLTAYLYYPFTRFYLGRSMGHRGVFPFERGTQAS
jgi:nitrate reductase gamma subunit